MSTTKDPKELEKEKKEDDKPTTDISKVVKDEDTDIPDRARKVAKTEVATEVAKTEVAKTEAKVEYKGEGELLDTTTSTRLLEMLFGAEQNEQDVERWHNQGFNFSSRVPFGLTQLYGGPCGILAPIQGFVIKELLFSEESDVKVQAGTNTPINPTEKQAIAALLRALTDIIDRAHTKQLIWATRDSEKRLYKKIFKDKKELQTWLTTKLDLLKSPIGVVLFVYSVMLSRGLDQVYDDFDMVEKEKPLVARFGHCTQEIVNLMLVGRAVTNVFDGSKDMGGLVLNGIPTQAEVGYLTLLESLAYSKVGSFLKCPKNPIWIVGSQTHYTVLFALDQRVGKVSEIERKETILKAAFTELDPEEEGFIQLDKLGAFLKKIGDSRPADEVQKLLVTDGMPVILWQNVLQHLSVKETTTTTPTTFDDWSCSVCTYMNTGTTAVCEICGQGKRPPPTPAKPKPETKHPSTFDLYHYNGLDGHGKSVAECVRVKITLLGEGVHTNTGSTKRGLREVICTRWSSAVVEYDKEPKIS